MRKDLRYQALRQTALLHQLRKSCRSPRSPSGLHFREYEFIYASTYLYVRELLVHSLLYSPPTCKILFIYLFIFEVRVLDLVCFRNNGYNLMSFNEKVSWVSGLFSCLQMGLVLGIYSRQWAGVKTFTWVRMGHPHSKPEARRLLWPLPHLESNA